MYRTMFHRCVPASCKLRMLAAAAIAAPALSASIDRGSGGGPFSGNTQPVGDDGNNVSGLTGK